MHKVSNKQFADGLASTRGKYHCKIDEVIESHHCGTISTQICEDVINYQKNGKDGRAFLRGRRPEFSMHRALKARVLDERHKFQTTTMELPMADRGQTLPLDAYVAKPKNSSMDFNGIASHKQQAPFFSPKAEHNATPVADLFCLRDAYRRKDGNLVASLKYNLLFKVKHDLCWRYKGTKGDKWYVTVASFPTSAQVVVNVKLITTGGHNWHFFRG